MSFWQKLFDLTLASVESFFPYVPTLSKEEVEATGINWLPPEIYYFTDDPGSHIQQRLEAILQLDRNQVSFWRKRRKALAEKNRPNGT